MWFRASMANGPPPKLVPQNVFGCFGYQMQCVIDMAWSLSPTTMRAAVSTKKRTWPNHQPECLFHLLLNRNRGMTQSIGALQPVPD